MQDYHQSGLRLEGSQQLQVAEMCKQIQDVALSQAKQCQLTRHEAMKLRSQLTGTGCCSTSLIYIMLRPSKILEVKITLFIAWQ